MKKTYLKSGFILSYIAIAVQSIISIVYTPVMLRLLGDSDYGLLQLATSTIASLGVLNFGFAGSYLRFYSSARASSDKNALAVLNGTYMSVFIGISILALIAGTFVTTAADKIFAATMSEWEIGRLMQLL
ncbi:MAG: oligosaccharide flippase family protein, partial [Clostridia bacterium]|nr:oligosaccharide flippase family protein [Clostridia bacterium]